MIIIQKHLEVHSNITKMSYSKVNSAIVNSGSFKYKIRITEKKPATGNTKDVEIAVPLK